MHRKNQYNTSFLYISSNSWPFRTRKLFGQSSNVSIFEFSFIGILISKLFYYDSFGLFCLEQYLCQLNKLCHVIFATHVCDTQSLFGTPHIRNLRKHLNFLHKKFMNLRWLILQWICKILFFELLFVTNNAQSRLLIQKLTIWAANSLVLLTCTNNEFDQIQFNKLEMGLDQFLSNVYWLVC